MDEVNNLLTRAVDKIYPTREDLEKVLRSGKKLTIYQGFDPTGIDMHIGHMIGLKKLAEWQKLGHKVIFLIGDGTGQAGDPSGKTRTREKFLNRDELRQNAKDYVMQAGKIVKFDGDNPVEIRYNGDWLSKLTLSEILDIAGHFSVQQLIERDLFQERLKNNETFNLREFLYPLLQGYDSVVMEVDVEVGGTDQTFNMLAGRKLVRDYLKKEKYVLTTPLLEDSQGRKIGKTEGNVIALNDEPNVLYGKIMALSDDVIAKAMEYLTDIPLEEIKQVEEGLEKGENPLPYKKTLAFEIVKALNNNEIAANAQKNFSEVVQGGRLPDEIIEITLTDDEESYINEDLLVSLNLASSKSEAKRLFEQRGVWVDGKQMGPEEVVEIKDNMLLKVGRQNVLRLKKPS